MELNFYSLSVLYLVYSFLGWVGETVVATIKGRRFANRGVASGPFCFIYGFTAVLLAISFADRPSPLLLFLGCAIDATVVEWLTAKLLERVNRRRWWDYSGKRFNVDGYICLQYSLLWGALGTATVLWGNGLLFKLYGLLPQWLVRPLLWVSITISLLDQLGAFLAVSRYAREHPHLEQLNAELEKHSDQLRTRLSSWVERRVQKAYPAAARVDTDRHSRKDPELCRPALAVRHRGISGRHCGDAVLPGDGGRLDEPFQPGLGSVQRGVGAGTGPLHRSAAEL